MCAWLGVQVMIWTGTILVAGLILYPLLATARRRGWCEFFEASPDDFAASLKEGYGAPPLVPAVSAEIAEIDELLDGDNEANHDAGSGNDPSGQSPHGGQNLSPRRSFWGRVEGQSPR